MKLVSVRIHGFKRFADLNRLATDGKLIAIVGPNEAGKTSILDALLHFNHTEGFRTNGPSQEITRGKAIKSNQAVIEATCLLDDADREPLKHIPEAADIRWMTISKRTEGGTFYVSLSPTPRRNLAPRLHAVTEVRRRDSVIRKVMSADSAVKPDEHVTLDGKELLKILDSSDQSLAVVSIERIKEFADDLESLVTPDSSDRAEILALASMLRTLASHEESPHPEEVARTELFKRRPTFLLFTDQDRMLSAEYNLNDYFRDNNRYPIPGALSNLASAARLDLEALHAARKAADEGKIVTLLNDANNVLATLISCWSQAGITVHLRLNEWRLHLLVKSTRGEFVRLAERSDGLRQFVALLVFLSKQPHSSQIPVLLIDEAENHLHYDAQADLMQMLSRQTLANQVIFTTHSIGCLPEDLGNIRLVSTDDPYSRIDNWFWDTNTPGFSPLLFGMGASTLAFIPVRRAVVAEGSTDFLLLPSLFREAANVTDIGFQVVPGSAEATASQIAILNNQSTRTAYLTDNDKGGSKIRRMIRKAGVPASRILSLPLVDNALVIEDYIDLNSYITAVNEELARSNGTELSLKSTDLQGNNRPLQLKTWCEQHGLATPSKRSIAYRLLEMKNDRSLLAQFARESFKSLYRQISKVLERP